MVEQLAGRRLDFSEPRENGQELCQILSFLPDNSRLYDVF